MVGLNQDDDDEQLDWLDQVLSASTAVWKVVVGHHPVYSGGQHGNTATLIDRVVPLLQRYGVQAYISGHDHDLQHIAVDGIHYLISGGGSAPRQVTWIEGTLFAAPSSGFMATCLTSKKMTVEFVAADGRSLYSNAINR